MHVSHETIYTTIYAHAKGALRTQLIEALRSHAMLAAPAGDNVVRFLPPLTIGEELLREGLAEVSKALKAL